MYSSGCSSLHPAEQRLLDDLSLPVKGNKESGYISELYPTYKNIRLFRILPSRLFIKVTDRVPIAYVKLYRYFCVDSEQVLFDLTGRPEAVDLPLIMGLERKIVGPKPGRRYNIKELITALSIIQEIKTNSLFKNYKIVRTDVTNPAQVACFIQSLDYSKGRPVTGFPALEIRTGQDDIKDNIRVLAGLLSQFKDDIDNIKYIDLRFKDPVVKFKDAD